MERRIHFAFTIVILVLFSTLAEQGNAGEENISSLFLPTLMCFSLSIELRVAFMPMISPRLRSRHNFRERGTIFLLNLKRKRFGNSKRKTESQKRIYNGFW